MAPQPAVTAAPPTVLVVDDDPLVRDMVDCSLRRAGYSVLLAGDGEAAIAAIARRTPDLIVTDLFMPNRDGIELLRSGRLAATGAPVITMSGGYGDLDLLGASQALGAAATISKPFMPRELLALVRSTLDPARQPADGHAASPTGP
jgi:DNA-binding response OmpR family regulator